MRGSIMLSLLLGATIVALLFAGLTVMRSSEQFDDADVLSQEEALDLAYQTQQTANLKAYQTGLEMYLVEYDSYPVTSGFVVIEDTTEPCLSLVPEGFLEMCYQDASGTNEYVYQSDGMTYSLERRAKQ